MWDITSVGLGIVLGAFVALLAITLGYRTDRRGR